MLRLNDRRDSNYDTTLVRILEAGDYMQPFSSPARFAAGASSTEGALI